MQLAITVHVYTATMYYTHACCKVYYYMQECAVPLFCVYSVDHDHAQSNFFLIHINFSEQHDNNQKLHV